MRTPGVEPGSQAWEACMMPLHYVRPHKQGTCLLLGAVPSSKSKPTYKRTLCRKQHVRPQCSTPGCSRNPRPGAKTVLADVVAKWLGATQPLRCSIRDARTAGLRSTPGCLWNRRSRVRKSSCTVVAKRLGASWARRSGGTRFLRCKGGRGTLDQDAKAVLADVVAERLGASWARWQRSWQDL